MPNPSKSNVTAEKKPKLKETDGNEIGPSHNLWVGNLSNETADSDLMDIFGKYGALDSVTTYSSRNFAFIYFKRLEDARSAKEALQGTVLLGSRIKIEFARPVRSSSFTLLCILLGFRDCNLWLFVISYYTVSSFDKFKFSLLLNQISNKLVEEYFSFVC